MNVVILPGCRPTPLAAYLKGLGIFRLITEQADPQARCFWKQERLVLQTSLSKEQLKSFFLNEFRPSPILAPWNGGSGFFPKDNDKALRAIESSQALRFAAYKGCLTLCRHELQRLQLKEKPEKEAKEQLLKQLRNILPEEALEWLDAAFLLTDEGAKYPPLLGTGGNDGRLDFTNNFMQRLTELFDPNSGLPNPESGPLLSAALFEETLPGLGKAPIGQFDPNGAGGANAGTGFDSPSFINPWDYLFMIEGALLFAVAAAKKFESSTQGQLAYPFCVRAAGVGYASESLADEKASRAEMWMPLWEGLVSLPELKAVLNEGRAQISGRPVRNGVDFARAISSLGVDRGFSEFQRFGFQVRNGLAYFATPLDRLPVQRNQYVRLLEEIDPWLDRFRSRAASDNPAPPAGVAGALRRLENSILRLCQSEEPARVQDVLCALGNCERTISRSLRWSRETAYLRPIQNLSAQWLEAADTGAPEYRLAAALASSTLLAGKRQLSFRHFLEPVELNGSKDRHWYAWREEHERETAWIEGNLTPALNAVLQRQLLVAQKEGVDLYALTARKTAPLSDITALIENQINEQLFTELLWGLCLLDWWGMDSAPNLSRPPADTAPDALYALLKLCFAGSRVGETTVALVPAIHHHAARGNAKEASKLAARRLHADGFVPAVEILSASSSHTRRTAAALLFPISSNAAESLMEQVLRRPEKPEEEYEVAGSMDE